MSVELALKIMKAISHTQSCPFSGCQCDSAPAASALYAEAAKVVRNNQVLTGPR